MSPTLEDVLGFVLAPPPGSAVLTAGADEVSGALLNAASLVIPVAPGSGDTSGATDLAAIAAALTLASLAGGGTVRLQAGSIYWISTPNTLTLGVPSGGTTTLSYALAIPSNVTIDINGATVIAASGALGALIVNAHPTNGGGDVGIGIISSSAVGIIDGNNQVPPVGARALIMMCWTSRPRIDNIRIQNGYTAGLEAYANTLGQYGTGGGIMVDTMKGGGIDLGQPFANTLETFATAGRLIARNCQAEPGNTFFNPGNGVFMDMANSSIDTIIGINNTGGDKLALPSTDVQIGKVYGINNGDSNGNSGFKFQGGSGTGTGGNSNVTRCEAGLIHMVNQNGTGLYMDSCIDCTVGKYIGENNALTSNFPDVWVGGIRDTINDLYSDGAQQAGLAIRQYAVDPTFGTIRIRNPNRSNTGGMGAIAQSGGYAVAGRILCVDELPQPTNPVATAQAGGGTFPGGQQYVWMITYTNANGETTPSPEIAATPALNGSVVLTWGTGALPSGVTGVKVYRSTVSMGEYTSPALVATLGAVLTYTDTGSAVGAGQVPTINTATTLLMKYGIQQTTPAAQLHAESIKVIGAATLPIAADGLISQAMSSGGQLLEPNRFIRPKTSNVTTGAPAQGTLTAMPIVIGESGTIVSLSVNVTSAGQAGALYRLGIYNDDGHGQPSTLLIDAGTVAGDAIGVNAATINLWVPAGRYHLAAVPQNCATTAPTVNISTGTVDPPIPLNVGTNLVNQNCFSQTGITGGLPATWGAGVQGATGVIVDIRS